MPPGIREEDFSCGRLSPNDESFWRRCMPRSKAGFVLLFTSFIQLAVVTSLESVLLRESRQNVTEKFFDYDNLPYYMGLFIAAQVWSIFLVLKAFYNTDSYMLFGLCVFEACTFVYGAFQIFQLKDLNQVKLLGSIAIFLLVSTLVTFLSAHYEDINFRWNTYHNMGADLLMKKIRSRYLSFRMLLHLDFFLWLAFFAQYLGLGIQKFDSEAILTSCFLVLTAIFVAIGYIGVNRESSRMMYAFIAWQLLFIVYFAYAMITVFVKRTEVHLQNTWRFLTFFSSISLFSLVLTVAVSVSCVRDFGYGFLEKRLGQKLITKKSPNLDSTERT